MLNLFQFIFFNIVIALLLNLIFQFNRTIYILIASLFAYFVSVCLLFYCGLELFGIIFLIILMGGVSIMFLFVLLVIDVRAENNKQVFFFNTYFFFSIIFSVIYTCFLVYFYLFYLNPVMSVSIFLQSVAFNNINEIFVVSFLLLTDHCALLLLIGFLLFLTTITALILSVNIFEKSLE